MIKSRVLAAIGSALGESYAQADPLLQPSTNPRFGDYQVNAAMRLGKELGRPPREVAQVIVDHLDTAGLCDKVEIAGPGFINLWLSGSFLSGQLAEMDAPPPPPEAPEGTDTTKVCPHGGEQHEKSRLGVPVAERRLNVVVDYSGPNVAKEMHVGHLRSTVIGDAIARVLAFQGHRVTRQNHLGDWGTQFGMLIEHLVEAVPGEQLVTRSFQIGDLNVFYQQAKQKFDRDNGFADRARRRVVALQSGDEYTRDLWQALHTKSLEHFDATYGRLDVRLTDDDIRGESFYNDRLAGVVEDLDGAGLLQESQGAAVVFPPGFKDRDGKPQAMIVRKRDGGYLYATTDLAAARYRINELGADRVVYVTDARQSQHFAMVFATLRRAGWAGEDVRLDHVPFGTVLGPDNKPFKTREGGTVKLRDLLDEAQKRATAIVAEKNPDRPPEQQQAIAHAIGIGALKYADLSNDRIKDYVFDWDRMLALNGNTAPYLQNAYVRIRSIFRKGGIDPDQLGNPPVMVGEPAERGLAVKLLQLPLVIDAVAESLEPHRLCTYLYELASTYHRFYESCPVLTADNPALRGSRLRLCDLVARTLRLGLGLLGIGVVEAM